jgi:very-short-patch-repair endonuclease
VLKILYSRDLKQRSRDLRNHSTLAEGLLWNHLKRRKMLGYRFMRQKPIHHFIVDFYCSKLKLAIEIDGESHRFRYGADMLRQKHLENMGVYVLRFNDLGVKKDIGNVLSSIEGWIRKNERQPPNPLC